MDADHMSAVGLAAARESEIARIRTDLDRAEALLWEAGIAFERTPNRAMPWLTARNQGPAPRPGLEPAHPPGI